MTTTQLPPSGYGAGEHSYDEMVATDGRLRPHWAPLAEALDGLGPAELARRQLEAVRLLDEDGVTYHPHGASPHREQRWGLDPVPVLLSSQEWSRIEAGLTERAELLNMVLDDLYGERDLLRRRVLPPEVVYGHDGFLRPCHGLRLPGNQQLFCYAADLVRDAHGGWLVLGDRAQAPSGFGYALENRSVTSRVFPSLYREAHVHRLALFFRALRSALREAAPPHVDDPRIVVLSPGPFSETAFEHAFLASTLGFPLVQGSDLTVHHGGVWMRSLGRLEPVHVILRRVDAWYCDPVELMPSSRLGVAGLVEATRRQTVSVVNTLGSGALENPGLMAFLPAISHHLLGHAPLLPSIPTWWCGDDDSLGFVLDNLDRMVLKPIAGEAGRAVFGWEQSTGHLDELRRRIQSRPHVWVGQEEAPFGSVPTLTPDGLAPRRSVLRTFAVARRDSYVILPGGLTRVAPSADAARLSNQEGATSKDTWVLASEPESLTGFWLQTGPAVEATDPMASIPSRAAENLYWLGRYAERAEDTTRLLRAVYDRRSDFQGSPHEAGVAALRTLLMTLTHVTGTYPGFVGSADELGSPGPELFRLVTDEVRAGSLAYTVRRLLDAAVAVRDQFSNDTWLVLSTLDRQFIDLQGPLPDPQAAVQGALQGVMQSLLAMSGLGAESMVHDLGWRFMDTGRRLERSLLLLSLLRATVTMVHGTASDSLVLESVLTAADSIITYRRRYRSQAQLETLLDLLVHDGGNPRSLLFQLDRLSEDLAAIPPGDPGRLREEQKLVLDAATTARLGDTAALAVTGPDGNRDELDRWLAHVEGLLRQAATAIESGHFVHTLPQHSLVGNGDRHPAEPSWP